MREVREKARERGARQVIKHLRGKVDRLKGLYLEGDVSRSGYNERKASIQSALAERAVTN